MSWYDNFHYSLFISLEIGCCPSFVLTWISFAQECVITSWLKLTKWFCRRKQKCEKFTFTTTTTTTTINGQIFIIQTYLSFRLSWARNCITLDICFFCSICYLRFLYQYLYDVKFQSQSLVGYKWEIKCKYIIFHGQLLWLRLSTADISGCNIMKNVYKWISSKDKNSIS